MYKYILYIYVYPCHKYVHWFLHRRCVDEHNVCSVTSEPSQSSSRRLSSFKNSPALLNI